MTSRTMKWDKNCRLGNPVMDSQHRLLFAIANELLEISNPAEEMPEIKYLFYHLNDYVRGHFKEEEEYMAKIKYPGLEAHKEKHSLIVHDLNNTIRRGRDVFEIKGRLYDLLNTWIYEHILIEDKKYATWARANNTPQSSPQP
jgi:hemerythrin